MRRRLFSIFVLIWTLDAADFYVAPNGTSTGNGSRNAPWSLAHALSHPAQVRAGDTIWLLGGTYQGRFTSRLAGAADNPIVVRQARGERATLLAPEEASADAFLDIGGSNTWYWGFEVAGAQPNRRAVRPGGLDVLTPNVRLINLVVHDTGQGIGFWRTATNSELSGCLIYYNGYILPDRAHGPGIYTQNETGTKLIADNIIFQQFSVGVQAFGSSAAFLNNFQFLDNVFFENARMVDGGGGRNRGILLGGGRLARNALLARNISYYPLATRFGVGFDPCYLQGCEGFRFEDNWGIAGANPMELNGITQSFTAVRNTLIGPIGAALRAQIPEPSNRLLTAAPAGPPQVFVRPNKYEAGRGHVTVLNFGRLPAVNVELGALLKAGDRYRVRDASNYFGAAVAEGVFDGRAVAFPTNLTAVAAPVDWPAPAHTAPEFVSYVVERTASAAPRLTAVTHAASGQAGVVAPGMIVTLWGSELGPQAGASFTPNAAGNLDSYLNGLRVLFGDLPGTLLYATPGQINAVAPYGIAGRTAVEIRVESGGLVSEPLRASVAATLPGLFTATGTGRGQAAAFNQDNTANGAASPAGLGGIVQLFATGEGQTAPGGRDGLVAAATLPRPVGTVEVLIDGIAAEVLYAGAVPGAVAGLFQVNARVPAGVRPRADVPVTIRVGEGRSPDGVTLAVR